ncbi:sugar phosphate isomerase/epimerase family protein [Microbacterium sp. 22215]|uniref:sugar phosphate isomerase/epimerase family protein n=1 Tax=Microbacterium sp. 22215 TaxID=3453893 RepID=UPI003F87371A
MESHPYAKGGCVMSAATNPVTLFTGQWVDLPLRQVAEYASQWGYDGVELACSGEHLDVARAAEDSEYLAERKQILEDNSLVVRAISNHLTGQAVCDNPIDLRHKGIVRESVWGDGVAEGVRQRAADELKQTAKVARQLGVDTVVGFSGSSIWQYVAMFPPVPDSVIDEGYEDFARRWNPILDVFDGEGVRFALEVHPSEIAYDYWTSARALEAVEHRDAFGFNWDPSHMLWQGVDPVSFITDFADKIYHVDCKDTRLRSRDGRSGILSSHLPWGDPRRAWDFVSTGRGDVPWEDAFRALRSIGYDGPISVEWEDAGMDRLRGAAEAVGFVRSLLWPVPTRRFDDAFSSNN